MIILFIDKIILSLSFATFNGCPSPVDGLSRIGHMSCILSNKIGWICINNYSRQPLGSVKIWFESTLPQEQVPTRIILAENGYKIKHAILPVNQIYIFDSVFMVYMNVS